VGCLDSGNGRCMMILAEIALKLGDGSEVIVSFLQDRLHLFRLCVWGNSVDDVYFYDEPELENIWDGFSWDLTMLVNLCEQFDFSEVM